MNNKSFSEFSLSPEVEKAVKAMGFSEPTSIQKQGIPVLMEGYSLIAKAPTGTGKTVAFGIPILEYLNMRERSVQNLILCPTRELALQIKQEMQSLGKFIPGFRICALIGGQPMARQIRELSAVPQVVVATPGRLLDLIHRKAIDISKVCTLVLDEADEMLGMGFFKDIRKIIELTPQDKQIALFSATMSRDVMDISWQYLRGAVEIDVAPKAEDLPQIEQFRIAVADKDKFDVLLTLIRNRNLRKVIIFCNTKSRVSNLKERLVKAGLKADCLHGDINQHIRNRVMEGFRKGHFPILVATDIAARGIDISAIDSVINFDVPKENEYYLHRIGRTGRAKKSGSAYTFVSYLENPRLEEICRYTKVELTELSLEEI